MTILVSHPQAQETRQDILTRLTHYMEQWELEANKWEAHAQELSASLNNERAAHEVTKQNVRFFQEQLEETETALTEVETQLTHTKGKLNEQRTTIEQLEKARDFWRGKYEGVFKSGAGERIPAVFLPNQSGAEETQVKRCPRCGNVLNNVSPGISVIAGGVSVCTTCLNPGEAEIARARGI